MGLTFGDGMAVIGGGIALLGVLWRIFPPKKLVSGEVCEEVRKAYDREFKEMNRRLSAMEERFDRWRNGVSQKQD